MTDYIVQEVRDARASIASEFGYDLSKYLVWIREQTRLRKQALGKTGPDKLLETTGGEVKSPTTRKRRVRPAGASAAGTPV